MTDEELEAGVGAGIITRQQLDALRAHAAARSASTAVADEERFRVLGGFNDILVAIGLALLVAGFMAASSATGNAFVVTLVAVASSWGLAELFTRRLKLALPSILLSGMFVGTLVLLVGASGPEDLFKGAFGALLCLVGSGAAAVHYWRFRVPIDVALGAAGVVGAIVSILSGLPSGEAVFPFVTLGCGLVVFTAAMLFDLQDPQRHSRVSDIGFWLHLLAAPLIVHSILAGFVTGDSVNDATTAATVLALFVVFALIALVVDRRALLVSGLTYAGYSLWTLFERVGGAAETRSAITLVVLALIVLGVSAGWRMLRAAIVPILPLGALGSRLPPATRR